MLVHLSPERFIRHIADFRSDEKWNFKCTEPTLVVFHSDIHLFAKGFRDVYDPLSERFPQIRTFEVLENETPEIAEAYEIKIFPASLFIPVGAPAKIVQGYLSPDEVIDDIKRYLIK